MSELSGFYKLIWGWDLSERWHLSFLQKKWAKVIIFKLWFCQRVPCQRWNWTSFCVEWHMKSPQTDKHRSVFCAGFPSSDSLPCSCRRPVQRCQTASLWNTEGLLCWYSLSSLCFCEKKTSYWAIHRSSAVSFGPGGLFTPGMLSQVQMRHPGCHWRDMLLKKKRHTCLPSELTWPGHHEAKLDAAQKKCLRCRRVKPVASVGNVESLSFQAQVWEQDITKQGLFGFWKMKRKMVESLLFSGTFVNTTCLKRHQLQQILGDMLPVALCVQ